MRDGRSRDGEGARFETYEDAVKLLRMCRAVWEAIGRYDRDLMRQLRKCVTAVPLNIAEAQHRKGGHARERLGTAYGSCRELKACLEVAAAAGYVAWSDVDAAWRLADSVCARIYRLRR